MLKCVHPSQTFYINALNDGGISLGQAVDDWEDILMCLGIPMQIITIAADGTAMVALDKTQYRVSLALIDDPQLGEYVIIHAGYAIEKLDTKEADLRLQLFAQIAQIAQADQADHPGQADHPDMMEWPAEKQL